MLRAPWNVSARQLLPRLCAVAAGAAIAVSGSGMGTAEAAVPARIAAHVPVSFGIKPVTLPARSSVDNARAAFGQAVMREAARHAGAPYVYGASGPGAFDCSGFTRYVFAKMGISLAHSSYAQYSEVEHIPASAALPGDIVFLNGLGHVGIYAGHGMMWDASSPGGSVSLRPIYSLYYEIGRVRI